MIRYDSHVMVGGSILSVISNVVDRPYRDACVLDDMPVILGSLSCPTEVICIGDNGP